MFHEILLETPLGLVLVLVTAIVVHVNGENTASLVLDPAMSFVSVIVLSIVPVQYVWISSFDNYHNSTSWQNLAADYSRTHRRPRARD
jgi:hypothetical protein